MALIIPLIVGVFMSENVRGQTIPQTHHLGFLASSEANTKYMYQSGIEIAVNTLRKLGKIGEGVPVR